MKFWWTLYPYQKEILDIFERERKRGDKKVHIVAPPGSWKTIVGLEIMVRLNTPTLILVPNLTLQEQWKDKIEKLFLEASESWANLISTSAEEIRKINIVTYQSLAGTDDTEDDGIHNKILDIWYESEKWEFSDKESFLLFASGLKEENPTEYKELYTKNQKKLKKSGDESVTRKLMKESIHTYITRLRENGVGMMIVDEAHHLTSWWSHVLFEIWNDLSEPYIIWLTATPPFESVDYFELYESYTKLLGTVDYYVPTPAIVKSGRLAPYSDLVYIVPPDTSLTEVLKAKEQALWIFLDLHKSEIVLFLHQFLTENFDRLKVQSLDLLEKWMRFVYTYKDTTIDMSPYITQNARELLSLEDIAKSVGKWGSDGFKKTKKSKLLEELKSLFFDLGYIWRWANLYRFQTPLEKWLIYSKSKMQAVEKILDTEILNLSKDLRVAIITDFLDVESDWINGHFIFDEVSKSFAELNPYLVSGQWIWKLENGVKILSEDETILSVTERLSSGETKLVIWTRWILWEWWDCPEVNTLIDLTGVSAYMSVNQVHGRAIRLDRAHPDKVANIYDVVCLGSGYQGLRDFERLKKKHTQFYGVDDSGLVIKELDHIYPQLEKVIHNTNKINAYTLKKSTLRSMVKTLWNIGGEYHNEEVFLLSIEIMKLYEVVPIPSNLSWWTRRSLHPETWKGENLLELGKSSYHMLVRRWIAEILDATLQVMKPFGMIPKDFTYEMKWSDAGSITISSNYKDPLVGKKFLETVASMFNPVTEERYIFTREISTNTNLTKSSLWSVVMLTFIPIFIYFIIVPGVADPSLNLSPIIISNLSLILSVIAIFISILIFSFFIKIIFSLFTQSIEDIVSGISIQWQSIFLWIPDIIASNDEKRERFTGKKYGAIAIDLEWYTKIKNQPVYLIWKKWFFACLWISLTISPILYWSWMLHNVEDIIGILFFSLFAGSLSLWLFVNLLLICWAVLKVWINFLYSLYARIVNNFKKIGIVQLSGAIQPVDQQDIGKPSFLSAKIEKLWI